MPERVTINYGRDMVPTVEKEFPQAVFSLQTPYAQELGGILENSATSVSVLVDIFANGIPAASPLRQLIINITASELGQLARNIPSLQNGTNSELVTKSTQACLERLAVMHELAMDRDRVGEYGLDKAIDLMRKVAVSYGVEFAAESQFDPGSSLDYQSVLHLVALVSERSRSSNFVPKTRDDRGKLTLTVIEDGDAICIDIQDNGRGFETSEIQAKFNNTVSSGSQMAGPVLYYIRDLFTERPNSSIQLTTRASGQRGFIYHPVADEFDYQSEIPPDFPPTGSRFSMRFPKAGYREEYGPEVTAVLLPEMRSLPAFVQEFYSILMSPGGLVAMQSFFSYGVSAGSPVDALITHSTQNKLSALHGSILNLSRIGASSDTVSGDRQSVGELLPRLAVMYKIKEHYNKWDRLELGLVQELMTVVASTYGVELDVSIPPECRLTVTPRMAFHLVELTKNAARAENQGGQPLRVSFRVIEEDGHIKLELSDTGLGFKRDEIAGRLKPGVSGIKGGTGMGTAFITRYCSRMGLGLKYVTRAEGESMIRYDPIQGGDPEQTDERLFPSSDADPPTGTRVEIRIPTHRTRKDP